MVTVLVRRRRYTHQRLFQSEKWPEYVCVLWGWLTENRGKVDTWGLTTEHPLCAGIRQVFLETKENRVQ